MIAIIGYLGFVGYFLVVAYYAHKTYKGDK